MKKRLITAAVGLTLLVVALCFHNTVFFDLAIILLNLIAMWETFVPTKKVSDLTLLIVSALYTVLVPLCARGFIPIYTPVVHTAFVAVIFAIAILRKNPMPLDTTVYAILITFLLSQSFTALITLSHTSNGLFYILYAFSCAWVCDGGAYFVGRKLGKTKMAPIISPKKTVEGAIGGLISSEIFAIVLCLVTPLIFKSITKPDILWVALLTPIVSLIGMLGDLATSYIKRSVGIKDFGKIFPGHGGVMDRFDSLLLIFPLVSHAASLIK